MIQESYYRNLPSRNILNDNTEKNISSDNYSDLTDISLESMIINSNLSDSSTIKWGAPHLFLAYHYF